MLRLDRQTLFLLVVVGLVAGGFGYVLLTSNPGTRPAESEPATQVPASFRFNADRAHAYVRMICDWGPRITGSEAMNRQQQWLTDHFQKLGAKVKRQAFTLRHPQTGEATELANLIVQWFPERKERILICCHYDTRPFADEDPVPANRTQSFPGANDGASGVALFAEWAHQMQGLKTRYGVDFVLFDAEEWIYDYDRDKYFIGSEHFARSYIADPPGYQYKCGILIDMIGDRDLQIYQERNSLRYARNLVRSVWDTARRLNVREFIPRSRHDVRDDHLPLNQIAKIPTIDLIDFDYPSPSARSSYWHTTADTPDKVSGESLRKVAWVLHTWLEGLE